LRNKNEGALAASPAHEKHAADICVLASLEVERGRLYQLMTGTIYQIA
jgi:hypothetical protein